MARPLNDHALVVKLTDVSTDGTVFVSSPYTGEIIKVSYVLQGAISSADADVQTLIGATAVTGSAATIAQSGSAAGDAYDTFPTAANFVTEGDLIGIDTDGASSTAAELVATIVIRN